MIQRILPFQTQKICRLTGHPAAGQQDPQEFVSEQVFRCVGLGSVPVGRRGFTEHRVMGLNLAGHREPVQDRDLVTYFDRSGLDQMMHHRAPQPLRTQHRSQFQSVLDIYIITSSPVPRKADSTAPTGFRRGRPCGSSRFSRSCIAPDYAPRPRGPAAANRAQ